MQNLVDDHLQDENNRKRTAAHTQKMTKKTPINASPAVNDSKGEGKGIANQASKIAKATAKAVGSAIAPYLPSMPVTPTKSQQPSSPPARTNTVSSDSWRETVSALAAEFAPTQEYKPLPASVKGGAICMDMLLHQKCPLGETCPRQHVSGHVCLNFQTKEGCKKRNCQFKHEVIGPAATKALINHCKQKATQNKSKAATPGKTASPAAKKAYAPKKASGPPPKSTEPCRNFHNPSSPGTCRFGSECRFKHD